MSRSGSTTSFSKRGPSSASTSKVSPSYTKPVFPTPKPSVNPNATKKCFECQGFGHIASDCPSKRTVTIIGDTVVEKEEEREMFELFDDYEEYGDVGHNLVIRRLLNASPCQEEEWLISNIFQTGCTSYGRVFNVIIDSGSCTNVVSEEMVSKLGLKTEPHPNPYKIQWFKNGNGVSVSKRCLVSLSIGKSYEDQKDACHLLLGRP